MIPMKNLLDLLKEEKKQEKNELKVDSNSSLKQMARGLKKVCYWYGLLYHTQQLRETSQWRYLIDKLCFINVPDTLDIDYINPNEFISAGLLTKFVPYLKEIVVSEYITALANCTKKEKVLINLAKMNELIGPEKRLDYLCHNNEKEIVIMGDAGYNLGTNMVNGIITINGDVKGNVGYDMEKGVINVNCAPGKKRFELNYTTNGGEIYYNNKLIHKDGKRIKFEGDSEDDGY